MYKIIDVYAREVLDSRGNPTVEVEMSLETKEKLGDKNYDVMGTGRSIVPSGASTGIHEALELRDGDVKRYNGKGVLHAINNVNTTIKSEILGKSFESFRALDTALLQLDGTKNKSKLGANAILGVSMAFVQACANLHNIPVYRVISKQEYSLPIPMMNILNGGAHADNNVDIQEFLIVPIEASSFAERLRMGSEVFHALKNILQAKGYVTSVGDEGGYAPNLSSNEEAFQLVIQAIEAAGYTTKQIKIAIDVAATEIYSDGKYTLDNKQLGAEELLGFYLEILKKYPIISIEDGFAEDDFAGRSMMETYLNKNNLENIMTVGDDLLVTNVGRIQEALDKDLCNSALIKPNQIGSVSETLDAIILAKNNGMKIIISHRSGETEDTFIADLAVAVAAEYIKTGSLSRSERMAKYNQLLRIEEQL